MSYKRVEIYTDGSCLDNGGMGHGGWGILFKSRGKTRKLSGYVEGTTNNRMEMTAAIIALETLKEPCNVILYSDSLYLVNAFNKGWLNNWQKNGWKNSSKKDVPNRDLWERLLVMDDKHLITWSKVKGHSDNEGNNLVDELANTAARTKTGVDIRG